MHHSEKPFNQQLIAVERLAKRSLCLWDIPEDAKLKLINVSENITFLIEASNDFKAILRVHRENYHTRCAIESELAWIDALSLDKVITTPPYYLGKNGFALQSMSNPELDAPRFLVLFHFLPGRAPEEIGNLTAEFKALGAIAAKCHLHVMTWEKPTAFERLTWDVETVFGTKPTWGNWRDAPGVSAKVQQTLETVENHIRHRLEIYGKAKNRYNLIHADMRLANLLVDQNGIRVIDFDDCGYGWFMYDFAAAISFVEDDPRIPECKSAWLEGYQTQRRLSAEDIQEIDTFVMLRRMALLAWIGSHMEAPEPQALASDFATNTEKLGDAWLRAEGVRRPD